MLIQALCNIVTALKMRICVVDASTAGLGGCPFAQGATGNVATEAVVDLLNRLGVATGVDLKKMLKIADFISKHVKSNFRK